MCHAPPQPDGGRHEGNDVSETWKAKVTARRRPEQAWEHPHEKYAKKAFFGYQTVEKKKKNKAKTFHTHELDANEINHKALISISVKIIVHFQSAKDLVMKAFWANGTTSTAAFLFFFSSVTQLSTDPWHMLDLQRPSHTHTHHHHPHPYLFWEPHTPSSGWLHYATIPRWRLPRVHRCVSVWDTNSQSDKNTRGE